MLKNCRAIAVMLLGAFLSFNSRAFQTIVEPDSPYVVDVWRDNDGLPSRSVFSVIQTHDGYLWFATPDGLVRFDGVKFTVFDEAHTPGLESSGTVYLFEDSRSNLWVGTESAGVFIIGRGGEVQKAVTASNLRADHPVSACEGADGSVWLLMKDSNLYRYHDKRLESVTVCKAITAEPNGQVWLGTDTGVYQVINSSTGVSAIQTIPLKQRLDFLLASRKGGFWLMADGRIQKWKDHQLVADLGAYPWQDWTVTTATEDEEGNLIVGTYGDGVYWFDAKGKATHLRKELSFNFVQSIAVDREGGLWVATDGGGLDRVKRKMFAALPKSEDYVVQSVAPDRQGGLWIGYNGNRIDHWSNGVSEQFTPILNANSAAGVLVRSVFVDKSGVAYAGITCVGAAGALESRFLEFQSNRFSPPDGINLVMTTQGSPLDVSAIHEDRMGRLWLGTRSGLVLFHGRDSKLFSIAEGLPSADVRAVADDVEGNVWIGTSGGLACLRDGKIHSFRKKDRLPSEDISSLLVDSEGILWIGTHGSGLVRFSKNRWTHYTTSEGLAGNSIAYLLEEGDNIWLGSNVGLIRVAKKSLNDFAARLTSSVNSRSFVEADGLRSRECTFGSQPAACVTTNGLLWFPTIQGLVFVDPLALKTNSIPPPVVIESVSVEGVSQSTNRFDAGLSEVVIPPGRGHLEIHYTSLNPGNAGVSRFKYRLYEGEQPSGWTDDDNGNRLAPFPKLPPGDYRFEVTACNEDGVWNSNPVSLTVIVRPQLWQRRWFQGLIVIAALCAIGGAVYYFSTQRLQRQLAFMRQQEALEHERARIARDLHDQLGANLTQVALLAEMAESDKNLPQEVEDHAQQISQTARETTKALDEIVWAVNPSNDTLDGLVNYAGKYAQEYFGLAGLRYRVDMPSQLPEVTLPPEVRHNVFLAFKESVNNVVKHAQAAEVHARLRLDETSFTFEIEDDGRGPAGAEQKTGRNGLRNMRKRMEDVGGSFSIGPAAEKGTIVKLTAPLRNYRVNAH
jgi:signal transduction histidine kinase/ligand-binding sensor domain-containing protein